MKQTKKLCLTFRGPNNGSGTPVLLGVVSSVAGVQSVPLPDNLPVEAKAVRIITFQRSGTEGPSRYSNFSRPQNKDGLVLLYEY